MDLREVEVNASGYGQFVAILLLFICWKVSAVIIIICANLIFGDASYYDIGNGIGLIVGLYFYFKELKKHPKNK